MKTKHWMSLGVLCLGALALEIEPPVFAQSPTPASQTSPPVIPAGDVPAPATGKADSKSDNKKADAKKKDKAATKKSAAKPSADVEKPRPHLSPGPAVANEKNVNLRGQAAINSEIVTRIRQGELVTVLEEVSIKAKPDEPDRWAKVLLPANSVVWISTMYIDPNSKAVVPKRLNVRSGPGENYSILGRIEKGFVVKEVETKGDWMKIDAPTNAYAFIASHLLSTDPAILGPALAKAHPPAPPPPTEVAVVTPPAPAPPPEPLTKPPTPPAETNVVAAPPPPPPSTATPAPPVEAVLPAPPTPDEPPAKRIVTREGIVKGSASIQAPTYFVLRNLDSNRTINYLHAPSNNIVMREYQLQRVIVTGEEVLDERWPNTPVIIVDSIESVPQ